MTKTTKSNKTKKWREEPNQMKDEIKATAAEVNELNRRDRLAAKTKTAQHTLGLWSIESGGLGRYVCDATGEVIATLNYPNPNRRPASEEKANASLIAAAPELLAACKRAANTIERVYRAENPHGMLSPIEQASLDQLQAAIARAEGRQA